MTSHKQPGTSAAALTLLDLDDDATRLLLARHFAPRDRVLKLVCTRLYEMVSSLAYLRVYTRLAPPHALAVGPKPKRP